MFDWFSIGFGAGVYGKPPHRMMVADPWKQYHMMVVDRASLALLINEHPDGDRTRGPSLAVTTC